MKHSKKLLRLQAAALLGWIVCSCASDMTPEEYAEKLEKKNKKRADYHERRRMKIEARQERTDMWFKRIMGTY